MRCGGACPRLAEHRRVDLVVRQEYSVDLFIIVEGACDISVCILINQRFKLSTGLKVHKVYTFDLRIQPMCSNGCGEYPPFRCGENIRGSGLRGGGLLWNLR